MGRLAAPLLGVHAASCIQLKGQLSRKVQDMATLICLAGDAGFQWGDSSWLLILQSLDCLPYTVVPGQGSKTVKTEAVMSLESKLQNLHITFTAFYGSDGQPISKREGNRLYL